MMDGAKVKVSCGNCGTTNYFPLDAVGKNVVCGRCKFALPEPGTVLEPAPAQVYKLFQSSSLPVLADFYSTTCGPCLVMHPIVERLARRRAGGLAVVRINIDRHPELARGFGIQGVPTFVVVFKGVERGRTSGAQTEEDLALWVASRA